MNKLSIKGGASGVKSAAGGVNSAAGSVNSASGASGDGGASGVNSAEGTRSAPSTLGTESYIWEADEISRDPTTGRATRIISFNNKKHKHILYLKKMQEYNNENQEKVARLQSIIEQIPRMEKPEDLYNIYFGDTGIWNWRIPGMIDSRENIENSQSVGIVVRSNINGQEQIITVKSYFVAPHIQENFPKGALDKNDKLPEGVNEEWHKLKYDGDVRRLPREQKIFYLNAAKREFREETGIDIDDFLTRHNSNDDFIFTTDIRRGRGGIVNKVMYKFTIDINPELYILLREEMMNVHTQYIDHEIASTYAKKYQKYKQKYLELKNKIL